MILNLQNIYKDYQQEKLVVPVLKDVSLTVEEGEYVAIMGPSRSGGGICGDHGCVRFR